MEGGSKSRTTSGKRNDGKTSRNSNDDSHDDLPAMPGSPKCLSREDVLVALGYRTGNTPKTQTTASVPSYRKSDVCRRCSKKVYPLEKIDIGDVYHRGCFKCLVCGIQLTLKTFTCAKDSTAEGIFKEIYCQSHQPWQNTNKFGGDAVEMKRALSAQKKASDMKIIRQYEPTNVKYDAEALEFQHARVIKQQQKVRRKGSLKSYADFEKLGVFDAQKELEKKHRREEDELYQEMVDERRNQIEHLEQQMIVEREQTVRELVAWFEQQEISDKERDAGLNKFERYFKKQREERIKHLLDKISVDEQAAITRLIDKHAQEMLLLIEEKEKLGADMLESGEVGYIQRDKEHERFRKEKSATDSHEVSVDSTTADGDKLSEDEEQEPNDNDDTHPEQDGDQAKEDEYKDDEKEDDDVDDDDDDTNEVNIASPGAVTDKEKNNQELNGQSREDAESGDESWESGEEEGQPTKDKTVNTHPAKVTAVSEIATNVPISKLTVVSVGDRRDQKPSRKDAESQVELKTKREQETQVTISAEQAEEQKRGGRKTKEEEKGEIDDEDDYHPYRPEKESKKRRKHHRRRDEEDEGYDRDDEDTTQRHHSSHRRDKHSKRDEDSADVGVGGSSAKNTPKSATGTVTQQNKSLSMIISLEKLPAPQLEEEDSEDDDDLPAYSSRPEICPPTCPKSKLYKSVDVFREFDRRAIKEAQKDPTSFTDLVRKLSRKCETELQKVRAIFRWITAKDLNKIEFSESMDTDSPMGLLRGIKFGTETYHNLFKRLCSYAGLHCEIIEGYSKGAGYQPGSHFHGHRFRNQWTAVWVDGSWRFINCNWGARHVSRSSDDQPIYQVDEFYFLTDPEQHIYQHFPDDARWQLLRHPISLEDFVLLPVIKSPFFNNHLEFSSKKLEAIIKSKNGAMEIRLLTPGGLGFAAKLRKKEVNDASDQSLHDCCIVRMIGNTLVVSAIMRLPGKYYLDIFVGSEWHCDSMDSACSLRIHCKSVAPSVENISYPPNICFGRTPEFVRYGMSEESAVDPLVIASGDLALRLKISTKYDDVRLSHTLRLWKNGSLLDCDRYAILRTYVRGQTSWLVRCPSFGLYAFSLLAAKGDDSPRCVYRYLIDCQKPVANVRPFPRATTRWHHCRLVEPLSGELLAKSRIRFCIESSLAKEILVNAGGAWTSLTQSGHVWEAVVDTGDAPVENVAKAVVYGRFDASSDKYIPLLNYVVCQQSFTDEVRTMLKYL